MILGAALSEALLATLANPATWPMALAAFFLRGGLLLVFLPIAVLPSPVGLGNVFAPTLMTLVFQGVSVEVALAAGLVVLAIVAWIVIGGLVAASLEAAAARIAVREDATAGPDAGPGPSRPVAARILVARLLAHVPTGVVLVWGSARLVEVTYRELTSPFDVATPIVLRVLRSAPDAFVAIVVAWMLGEIIGAIAARRIVLAGVGVRRALRDAILAAIRRPLGVLLGFWVPTASLVLVVVPSTLAATAAWGTVRIIMRSPNEASSATLAVVLFVTVWMVGLVLIAVMAAWRAAVWSVAHREPVPRAANSLPSGSR